MENQRKHTNADLRKYYTLFLEIGLIAVLLIFIVAMTIDIHPKKKNITFTEQQEIFQMEEIIQTKQINQPPPPPRPPVPVEVPNDEIIEETIIDFSADLDLNEELELPPPPKEVEEEEDFFVAVEHMPELIGGLANTKQHQISRNRTQSWYRRTGYCTIYRHRKWNS